MTYLELASRYLGRGLPIPLDIAAHLMDQGIDVEALERKFGQARRNTVPEPIHESDNPENGN